ncbi:MAG: hypothetical protein LBG73_01855 [Spirochaetaceae bacterium]|jgi:hypothetical protein|nr:hypothetical protein [Spirochaetaceae bacterium]
MKKTAYLALIFLAFIGCREEAPPASEPESQPETVTPRINSARVYTGEAVQKADFTGTETQKQIRIENLDGHSVFIVKVNTSDIGASYKSTGFAYPVTETLNLQKAAPLRRRAAVPRTAAEGGKIPLYDHPSAREFNRNPPPIPPASSERFVSVTAPQLAVKGEAKQFWVQNKNSVWQKIPATLYGVSSHSNVWIANEAFSAASNTSGDNKLTPTQAQSLADKFETIYGYETALFGYEYGGGGSSPAGGVDGDTRIQILVYDIDYDADAEQDSFVLGYFWSKDFFDQTYLDRYNLKTNKAEIFYLDSWAMDAVPELIYSTLVHEFQHMINFNQKYIKNGKSSSTWYDEMLSMLAEDMISPLIGISSANAHHPINTRIPYFLGGYNAFGVTQWSEEYPLFSYGTAYAFGAYLARNYGGPKLIKEIARNSNVDASSITAALSSRGADFTQALKKYGEALVYSGTHKTESTASFDNTVSDNIYAFNAFDIWNIKNIYAGAENIPKNYQGALIWSLDWLFDMPGNSLILQSLDSWQGVTGSLDILVSKPENPAVDIYIMIR